MTFQVRYDLNNGVDYKLFAEKFPTLGAARAKVLAELNSDFMLASTASLVGHANLDGQKQAEYRKVFGARAKYLHEAMLAVWNLNPGDKLNVETDGEAHYYEIVEKNS